MSYKFFYLYLIGGTAVLALLIYQVIVNRDNLSVSGILFNVIPIVLLYYMAFKVYHEKKDKDLM